MHTLNAKLRHGYGIAAFSLAIANTSVMFFLLKYLVDHAGISPLWAGTVLLIGKAWDAVSDPLVGRLSDRTRTTMGARRPWIAGATVPLALLFAALWWGLPVTGTAAIVAYSLLLIAYNTAYTAVVVPYGALTPALTDDYDERTRLNGARMAWSMVGGIVAGIAMPMMAQSTGSFRLPGLALGALMVLPLLGMVWATAGRDNADDIEPSSEAMWTVLKVPAFRRVALLFVGAWSSIAVLSALIPFFLEHHVHRKDMLDGVFAAIQLSALVFIPAVVWLAKKVEKHTAYAIAMATWAAVQLGLASLPEGALTPVFILAALAGGGVAAAHVLPWSMLPDVVELDALENGKSRAGAFYGVMTFLEKSATAVSLWALGLGLELAGYQEGAAVQPEAAVDAIRMLLGPAPALVLLVAAIAAIVWPPVNRAVHASAVKRLQAA